MKKSVYLIAAIILIAAIAFVSMNLMKSPHAKLDELVKQTEQSGTNKVAPHLTLQIHGDDGKTHLWDSYDDKKMADLYTLFSKYADKQQLLVTDTNDGRYVSLFVTNCDEYKEAKQIISELGLNLPWQAHVKEPNETSPLDECLADQRFD